MNIRFYTLLQGWKYDAMVGVSQDEILKMISLLTDELSKKEKSKGIIDLEIHKEKGEIFCPNCHSKNIKKNGKYIDRQLYKCKDCNKKFN